MPRQGQKMNPWTAEEDAIVRASSVSADVKMRLKAIGSERSEDAIRSRRKLLLRGKPLSRVRPSGLAGERVALEQELLELERRREVVKQRLLEVRLAQARDVLQDVELPEGVMEEIRRQLEGDG